MLLVACSVLSFFFKFIQQRTKKKCMRLQTLDFFLISMQDDAHAYYSVNIKYRVTKKKPDDRGSVFICYG